MSTDLECLYIVLVECFMECTLRLIALRNQVVILNHSNLRNKVVILNHSVT